MAARRKCLIRRQRDFLVRLSGCLEQREQYAFCFSVQAIGWEQECTALPQLRDMRRVGWLVDDPFFHEARLIGSVGTGAYVLTVQDAFTQRIREMYPKFEMIETLYHGGFASEQVPRWKTGRLMYFFPELYVARSCVGKIKKDRRDYGKYCTESGGAPDSEWTHQNMG